MNMTMITVTGAEYRKWRINIESTLDRLNLDHIRWLA
jgi:hypothetical protein